MADKRQPERPAYYTQREWNRIVTREREEHRRNRNLVLIMILLLAMTACIGYAVFFFVFRSHDSTLQIPYDAGSSVFGLSQDDGSGRKASAFAQDLCVTDDDVSTDAISITSTEGALFDVNNEKVLYAKDVFEERSMASLTKIMTALVAMKYGNLDDEVTVTSTAFDITDGSSVCELHLGDVLTLKQLIYGMLIASGNDAAMMVAEHVGGSVEQFVSMMNQEALEIGATRTHFVNPYGMTEDGHYTCAYDIYLTFNAAMQYDVFLDIISRENYYALYRDKTGDAYAMTWESTDHYLTGEAERPDNVTIYGGKTGTTQDAGACLCVLSKDAYGNPYISVILNSGDKDQLYVDMNQILSLVPAA